ncbi:SDR family NAD(P)-dependent oxidoreductase [Microbacterium saperdae]
MTDRQLTTRDSLNTWLKDPTAGPVLRELLEAGGHDEKSLRPARLLSLDKLVAMSKGRFPQSIVDELLARVGGANETVLAEEPETDLDTPRAFGRFTGRTIIVTGAASGIGRATAERIAAEGGRVIAVDLSTAGLETLVSDHPNAGVVPVTASITDPADVSRVVDVAGGSIDGLANVAGIMDGMMPLHEASDELWRRVFAVNVDGAFLLSRAVLPAMLRAGSGSIVNVASEAALRGNAAGTAYTASKHAVVGMTKSSAFLYGPEGIRTNAVAPGPVATGISGTVESTFAAGRLQDFMPLIPPVVDPERIAATITWLLSDDSENVNGILLASDGGWSVQ